ncbi:MAG: hypothetical protein ACWGPN_16625, partial [Gammaproteobacteria bacterium]
MSKLTVRTLLSAGLVGLAFAGAQAIAQTENTEIPRTPAGKPSFQGHWSSATVTPFERPRDLAEKEFFTPQEFADYEASRLVVNETEANTTGDVHYQLTDFGLDRSQNERAINLRTSIVTDPPNGRLPATTPEADALAAERRAHRDEHGYDSASDRPLAERCIIWPHNGPPMLPSGYNSNNQIVQTGDYLVFVQEMMQEPRIIPLDGRKAVPDQIQQWYGSSVGHWEGETIVVETTNFTGLTGRNISPDGKVTERFSMLGPDTILYQFTVEDPQTWVAPWSGEYTMTRTDGPMFEYACHEGNYGIAN